MQLTRAELFDHIWSEPMGTVAARYGLTGNGLAKICDRLAIPRPSRSHLPAGDRTCCLVLQDVVCVLYLFVTAARAPLLRELVALACVNCYVYLV